MRPSEMGPHFSAWGDDNPAFFLASQPITGRCDFEFESEFGADQLREMSDKSSLPLRQRDLFERTGV
jgi:hypothetical protein